MSYVINIGNQRMLFQDKESAVYYFNKVVESGWNSEIMKVGTTIIINTDGVSSDFDEEAREINVWKTRDR